MSLVGNLEDLGLGEILQIVSLSRKSGILTLHSKGREGQIVMRQGQVVRSSATTYRSNIGDVLIQKGILSGQSLAQALSVQEAEGFKERLGTILIGRFGVPENVIEGVVREQIENVVYSLFSWTDGTFDFELHDNVDVTDSIRMDPLQFMLDQGINPQFLAMEGSRILDEMRHSEESDGAAPAAASPSPEPQTEETVDFAFHLVQPTETPAAEPAPPPPPGKRQLVMVDDEPAFCESLRSWLVDGGYEVSAHGNGEETLFQVDTFYRAGKRPSVLVDLIMPRMDGTGTLGGLELLALIHRNFPDLPVLALADSHNSGAESRVRQMGYGFMMKPRTGELGSIATVSAFSGRLLDELKRVEAGEGQTEWHDKINLGDEIRLEMGEEPVSADAPAAPQSTGIALLRGMLEELYDPALGSGIILLVLRFASEFMNRAVVFFVKRDMIVGLGQFGIEDDEGLADSRVRNLRIPRREVSLFNRVIETQSPVKLTPDDSEWNRYLQEQLGGGKPAEVFLGPIISEGKVVAVLYGDTLPESRPVGDTDALEIFLSQAGLAMEKALLLRRLKDKSAEET